ncbi:PDR/VanB family oxidoreductase [Modicisalibacter coralii]|uniref:PDR/VanB family oxidoreductase n=1 Tax=Modicisalibacter coralii TaxID=2304602 RepID=UPI00100AA35E|nr:PDR/VanB family oxidoreductase [Halomonas coralii]
MQAPLFPVRVRHRTQLAEGIIGLELVAPDGQALPAFGAGAHIDVELPNGLIRQYSLIGDSLHAAHYEIAILREPQGRGGSACAHDAIQAGDTLRIGSPRNQFTLVPARHTLLFAGGIGVTPILAMAEQLARQGDAFTLHYCTRSSASTAFRERLANSAFAERIHFHFDDGDATQRLDSEAVLATVDDDSHLYVCGPAGFMEHVIATARRLGWPDDRIHREYFAGAVEASANADDGEFEVELAATGQVVRVPPEQTVAEALMAAGIEVALSCEQGICGSCAMRVVDGDPEHRDMFFSDEEHAAGQCFTPCCSRARSPRLVLDFFP